MIEEQALYLKIKLKENYKTKKKGLFCYKLDSRNLKEIERIIINNNNSIVYVIYNNINEIFLINSLLNYYPCDQNQILFQLRQSFKTKCYEIINPIIKCNKITINDNYIEDLNNKFWYKINSKDNLLEGNDEDYFLNENDIIKLGRIKYEVIKMRINKEDDTFINFTDSNNYNISEINKKAGPIFKIDLGKENYKVSLESLNNNDIKEENNYLESEDKNCWICFDNLPTTIDNPKIKICKCNKFVHYSCYKLYLRTKLIIYENLGHTVCSYYCNKFNCDICLTPFPTRLRIPEFNKIYELIDLNLPEESNYIILESLDYKKDKNNIKNIHVIQLNDEEIYIGRNIINDIIIREPTVSRFHAILKYNENEGKVILKNISGTYGTLALIRGNIKMKNKNLNLQIGDLFITVKLIPREIIQNNINDNT